MLPVAVMVVLALVMALAVFAPRADAQTPPGTPAFKSKFGS